VGLTNSRIGVLVMEYRIGKPGRIIAARLFEGEDIYESIESIARKENIKAAAVLITGGFRKADVVVGPKQEKPRIVGNFKPFVGPGEVLGVGTIYCDDKQPKLHIHTAIGKEDQVMVGCPRGGASTFLILEVTIIEIDQVEARRKLDESTGLNLLKFE
jgi:predicted DNA-binding protein with PD1-like motif